MLALLDTLADNNKRDESVDNSLELCAVLFDENDGSLCNRRVGFRSSVVDAKSGWS